LAVDGSGNIFIADAEHEVIREVRAATQTIQTIAGNGYLGPDLDGGFSGDGSWATQAELSLPGGLAVDSAGNVLIADLGNGRIRKLTPVSFDFQVSASPGSITIAAGQSAHTTLTVAPVNGFNQQVSFSCAGLPAGATCSASSVTPNGSAVQTTLTITTTAVSAQLHPNLAHSGGLLCAMMLSGFAGLLGLISCGKRPRHGIRTLSFFAVLTVSSLWMAACGGGGGSNGGGSTGTPAGTYTITVKSTSGPIVNTTTLTLTVN
jgi:hypothetical protein